MPRWPKNPNTKGGKTFREFCADLNEDAHLVKMLCIWNAIDAGGHAKHRVVTPAVEREIRTYLDEYDRRYRRYYGVDRVRRPRVSAGVGA